LRLRPVSERHQLVDVLALLLALLTKFEELGIFEERLSIFEEVRHLG
jgi:hypothetical protein